MESSQSSASDSVEISHLLRVPVGMISPPALSLLTLLLLTALALEVRLQIYRYLLLPTPEIILDDIEARTSRSLPENKWPMPYGPDAFHENFDDGEALDLDSEGWEDEDEDEDDFWEDEDGMMGTGCICGMCPDEYADELSMYDDSDDSDDDMVHFGGVPQRHPAILYVSRQIYREASSMFYAEAVLVLEPDDILCLATIPSKHQQSYFDEFDVAPRNVLWRYDPRNGLGKKNKKGEVIYRSPKLEGLLDPHVFARFRKIRFDVYLDQDDLPIDFTLWIDDETLTLNQEQAEDYVRHNKRLPIIKDFVKIISKSPLITHLNITLETDVEAQSVAIVRAENFDEDDEEMEGDDETEDVLDMDAKAARAQYAANKKCAELLADSGLFNPLLKLNNVKNFNFKFQFQHLEAEEEPKPYNPTLEMQEKITAMTNTIQGRFKEPNSRDISRI